MVEQHVEQETTDGLHSVETALTSLWDKAREASLLIYTLREEKKRLLQRIDELEGEVRSAKDDVVQLQGQMERLQSATAVNSSAVHMEEEEKRQLQQKLRNVISKLDQYLTP